MPMFLTSQMACFFPIGCGHNAKGAMTGAKDAVTTIKDVGPRIL